ncbi:MAG: RAQPRD family integrative conjugative element protein, partial [Methylomonas sp.]|nr:RAQPRD family integrative conjugative element protein [Methylomonas sp.]
GIFLPSHKQCAPTCPGQERVSMLCNKRLLLILLCLPGPVLADLDGERTALAKLMHELDGMEPLIAEAQSQAEQAGSLRFQYDWLFLDIERIKLGIQEHLTAPRQARSFPPLKGDYWR